MEMAQFIKFGIKQLDEKEVLCVQCSPSPEAVFLRHDKDEDFYIRVGPGSRKLTSRETLMYINNRQIKSASQVKNSLTEPDGATS
jgi:predicted HTH transcriptional regulator